MPKRILVTGGAGFIGSHLVERLLERGETVHVVDDLSTGGLENLKAVRHHPNLHLNVDSVLNWPMMNETVERCEHVVHLAAAVGVRKIIGQPVETITTNVRGSEIVLDCCARHEVPLFVASTPEVYGKAGVERLVEDRDRLMGATTQRRWAFACTKALEEFLALAYHTEKGLPVVIGRIFNSVGPRQSGRWGMVLPSFVGRALRDEPLEVYGPGTQRRCFCHVQDTVEAILGLLDHPDAQGQVFNIGSEEEVTIAELAERVNARVGGTSPIEHVPYEVAYGVGFEDMERRLPDTGKIRRLTGWTPTFTLDQIIDETAEHLRAEISA